MDQKALAETYVDLWNHIDNRFGAKSEQSRKVDVVNMIFEQTCKRIISDLIGKHRQGVPAQKEQKPKSGNYCNLCGKELTIGELKYIEDTKSERICYKCSH
jgi:hypothetical protein